MTAPPTLVAALERASARADAGFHHHGEGLGPARRVSYAALLGRAQEVGAALQAAGLARGDRVGLILPDSEDFIDAIFGCMVGGLVPVPLYPPLNLAQLEGWTAGAARTLQQAGARWVLTDEQVRPLLGTFLGAVPSLQTIDTLRTLRARGQGAALRPERIGPDDVAFLQFTSGSTARPKGVTLSHANLTANMEAICASMRASHGTDTVGVSWLPLYHDMGLIGYVFTAVYTATLGVHLLSPLGFLKRPASWLRLLSQVGGTSTFAPNFAYGLATTRVRDAELEGLDLSRVTVAGCGAEPIQHSTLQAFASRYAPFGFRRTAFLPAYGLAESTLAVSFLGLDEDLRADRVDPEALALGEARPAQGEAALELVCCGRAMPGHALRITDEQGAALPEGRVGHIELRGPSVMRGYWGDPERTAEALREGWLRTGDLGYLKGGELYVCGRSKDLIIVHGRNYHPPDLEAPASAVPGVRRGNVVAFALSDPALGRERVVLAAELRPGTEPEPVRAQITAAVLEAVGLRVDEVVLLPPGSLPKTSSGKLQRARAAELYAQGALAPSGAGKLALAKQLVASRWGYLKAGLGLRGR